MKKGKIAITVLALVALLTVTGCGAEKTKKVVCTRKVSTVDITFNVTFKGNKLSAMDLSYGMDLSSYSNDKIKELEKEDFCASVKNVFGTYKEAFTNCKQSIKDKKLSVAAELEISKITSNVKDVIGTPKDAKESLESSGYTCEIK